MPNKYHNTQVGQMPDAQGWVTAANPEYPGSGNNAMGGYDRSGAGDTGTPAGETKLGLGGWPSDFDHAKKEGVKNDRGSKKPKARRSRKVAY